MLTIARTPAIAALKRDGLTILLSEPNREVRVRLADRAYLSV